MAKHDVLPFVAGVVVGAAVHWVLVRQWQKQAREVENVYETDALVSQYLTFHYSKAAEALPYDFGPTSALDFPTRVADECVACEQGVSGVQRALDVGCAVGRSSFELARHYSEVVGIDYSHRFIDEANRLKRDGRRPYAMAVEGYLVKPAVAEVDPAIDRSRVQFEWGDACNLSDDLGQFGVVLAANLVDRLPDARKFLRKCWTLVAPGGILLLATPYTFLEEFTPKSQWLGGYVDAKGQEVRGIDTLKKELGAAFELVEEKDMPFFIRETARKNQWTVSHMTAWRRRKV